MQNIKSTTQELIREYLKRKAGSTLAQKLNIKATGQHKQHSLTRAPLEHREERGPVKAATKSWNGKLRLHKERTLIKVNIAELTQKEENLMPTLVSEQPKENKPLIPYPNQENHQGGKPAVFPEEPYLKKELQNVGNRRDGKDITGPVHNANTSTNTELQNTNREHREKIRVHNKREARRSGIRDKQKTEIRQKEIERDKTKETANHNELPSPVSFAKRTFRSNSIKKRQIKNLSGSIEELNKSFLPNAKIRNKSFRKIYSKLTIIKILTGYDESSSDLYKLKCKVSAASTCERNKDETAVQITIDLIYTSTRFKSHKKYSLFLKQTNLNEYNLNEQLSKMFIQLCKYVAEDAVQIIKVNRIRNLCVPHI